MRHYALLLAGISLLPPVTSAAQAGAPAAVQAPKPAAKDATAPKPDPAAKKERAEVKVPAKTLQTYVGEYEMAPDRTLTITLETGSLFGQPTGQPKRQLFAEAPTKFFLKDLDVQLTFQKDAKGAVTGLLMDQAGRPQRELKKVK